MHASGPVIGVAGHEVLICMLQALSLVLLAMWCSYACFRPCDWCCWPCGAHMHASSPVIGVAGHEVLIYMLQAL